MAATSAFWDYAIRFFHIACVYSYPSLEKKDLDLGYTKSDINE